MTFHTEIKNDGTTSNIFGFSEATICCNRDQIKKVAHTATNGGHVNIILYVTYIHTYIILNGYMTVYTHNRHMVHRCTDGWIERYID